MTSNAQGEQPREQHCHCHGEAQAAASQPRSRAELDKSFIQAHVACSLFCIVKVLHEAIDEAIVIHGYPLLASAGVSAVAQRPVRYVSVTCALEADLPVVLLAAVLRIAKVWHWCVRRERQSAIYEFEAGQQTLREAGGSALRPFLATADAAWTPLRDAAGAGQPAPVFNASERLLAVMETVTEHCSRIT